MKKRGTYVSEMQGGGTAQINGASIQEETFREVVKGSQNIILKGIMKMLDDKLKTTGNPSVAQLKKEKQMKKLNLTNVTQQNNGKTTVTNRSLR